MNTEIMAPKRNKRNEAGRAIAQAIIDQYQPKNAPRGSLLEKNDDFVCCVNETQGQVEISMVIDLSKDVDFCDKLYQNYITLNKCLHYNENSLKKLCKQIAKRGCN